MSAETAREWLRQHAADIRIIDNGRSTATVAEAADALGVEPARIAKSLAVRLGDRVVLVVARGDARLDNAKCKAAFGVRPRMLNPEDTFTVTGHQVGGVCPFGLATEVPVVLDRSLENFPTVFPAAGSRTASIEITPDRLLAITGAAWVDVCIVAETPGTRG